MATTFATVLARAKRLYGLDSSVDDPLLSNALFTDSVNEVLQEAAEECEAFREELTLNLSGTVANHTLSSISGGTRILRVIERTVRIDRDGDGIYELQPNFRDEAELLTLYGPLQLEPAGVPAFYYLRRVDVADGMLELSLFPGSDQARTNGIKLHCQVCPVVIAATSDNLPLQTNEERFLLPGLCRTLARAEMAQGRKDAPVAYWSQLWEKAKDDWREAIRKQLDGDQRRIIHIDPYW